MAQRLIDATTLRAEFTGNFHELWHYTGIWAFIDNAPTIDPWKHGKWIVSKEDWVYSREVNVEVHVELEYECSVCGKRNEDKTNYCPHCGAKMDKEE